MNNIRNSLLFFMLWFLSCLYLFLCVLAIFFLSLSCAFIHLPIYSQCGGRYPYNIVFNRMLFFFKKKNALVCRRIYLIPYRSYYFGAVSFKKIFKKKRKSNAWVLYRDIDIRVNQTLYIVFTGHNKFI